MTAAGHTGFLRRFMLPETISLVQTYMFAESQQGMSQEHLLCLGKGVSGSGKDKIGTREWYAATIGAFETHYGAEEDETEDSIFHDRPKLAIKIWWGELDTMVPREARGERAIFCLPGIGQSLTVVFFI
jgi:hypothetical protein